jgi:hypothetical protein
MSLRPPPAVVPDDPCEVDEDDEDEDDPDDADVEYFVDVDEGSSVCISVPNSAQSSHTSSSAPSILTVFGEPVSVPHISH